MLDQLTSADLANVLMTLYVCLTVLGCFVVSGIATVVGLIAVSKAATKVFPNQKLPVVTFTDNVNTNADLKANFNI